MNNTQNTTTQAEGPVPRPVSLGLPPEMNLADICRGMLTGWPQLSAALRALVEDPQFRYRFQHSYGAGGGMEGGAAQLLAALLVDPTYLTKPVPPLDAYAWTVWLTMRVFEAAQTISVTLSQLPGLFAGEKPGTPAEVGALVREVLAGPFGLVTTADAVAGQAADLQQHLHALGGALAEAQAQYEQSGVGIGPPQLVSESGGVFDLIVAHADAQATTHATVHQLAEFTGAAAQVSTFAVITNMTQAITSLAQAWLATKAQFQAVAGADLERLGSFAFLQEQLNLATAAQEWATFADVTKTYLERTVLLR